MIFLCIGLVRDYNSSVRMRAMSYIIIKKIIFTMLVMQVIKVLNTYFTKTTCVSIKHTCVCLVTPKLYSYAFMSFIVFLNCFL